MAQEKWLDIVKNFGKNDNKKAEVKYLGRKDKLVEENKEFVKICKLSQKQLKNTLICFLYDVGYKDVYCGDGFVYAKGNIPFCLTAHMDTVHKQECTTTYEYNKNGDYILSSPQGIGGDDRCGIYMIYQCLNDGFKPYVIFCEDEEIGCIGSQKFCKTQHIEEIGKECKYIIELDRANAHDAVYYDCDNPEFEEFITSTTGYKTAYGSCSDISYLCPQSKIAGVNLSCGYYNAHTVSEYVNMTEMNNTLKVVEKLLQTECVQFEYKEKVYKYGRYANYYGRYGNYYGNYYGDYYDEYDWIDGYNKKKSTETPTTEPKAYMLEVMYFDKMTNEEDTIVVQGTSEDNCWTNFFFNNPTLCYNDIYDFDLIEV